MADDWGTEPSQNTYTDSAPAANDNDWGATDDNQSSNNFDEPRRGRASSRANDNGFGGGGGGGWQDNGDNGDNGPKRRREEGGIQFGSRGRDRPPRTDRSDGMDDDENEPPPPFRPEEVNLEEEEQFKIDQGINFDRFDSIKVEVQGDAIEPVNTFSELITSQLLLNTVEKAGYKKMTPIQRYTIPAMVKGHDLVGVAQTGSGKTAAFLLPVLQYILNIPDLDSQCGNECQKPYCIIIAPTRELAKQTYVEALKLSSDSVIKCQFIYGGIQTGFLRSQISRGTHVLVATPGRLKDFVGRGLISFENIKYMILDEGDRLIDDGFSVDMRAIFNEPTMPPKDQRQTMFFSATFKAQAQSIAKEFMKSNYIFITVGMVGAANEDVKQEFRSVQRIEKKRVLKTILEGLSAEDRVIVFTQTKITADIISAFLSNSGIQCTSIHGDRHQCQREQALTEFKRGTKKCLVASPVGERGLDLPKVSMVINYDMPMALDEYIHRIGRTGRIGNTGRAISFFDPDRDSALISDLTLALKQAQQPIPDFFGTGGYPAEGGDQSSNNGGSNNHANTEVANNAESWD